MGQRANYILIENNKQTIHYNHWRANCIASDLYLGEKRFIEFVKSCKLVDVLLDEIWIEGCVIINIDKKTLYFWSLELGGTSVTDFYVKELQNKWKDWSVKLLYNQMYDMVQILNIDYTSKQAQITRPAYTVDEIIDDVPNEWGNTIIIVKTENQAHITQTGTIHIDGVLPFGEEIISILLNKRKCELPKEESDNVFETIIIDSINKEIIIDKSEYGLWEQSYYK